MTEPYREDEDFRAANEAFERARFGEALSLYAQVSERYPNEPELKKQLALCSFESALQKMGSDTAGPDDWRRAIQYLKEVLKTERDSRIIRSLAVSHHNLGAHLNQQGAYKEAQHEFEQALELNPDMPEVSVSLAINHSGQGDFAKAEEILREVIEQSPGLQHAYHTLALVLSAQGKEDEAVAEFKRAQSPERDTVSVHYNLGVSYCNQGRLDLAEDAFRQTLELNPEFVPALYNLGLILREKEDLPGAEQCFEEVIRQEPDSPGGYFCLASLYEKRKPARAIPVWERYLELAAKVPSEAETVAKVTRHVAALKARVQDSKDSTDQKD